MANLKKDSLEHQLEDSKKLKYKHEEVKSRILSLEDRLLNIASENKSLK